MNHFRCLLLTAATTSMLTGTAVTCAADTLYLNTWDAAGNVNLGTDETDAAAFFFNASSFGDAGTTLSEAAFSGSDANAPGASAGGAYAVISAPAGGGTTYRDSSTTSSPGPHATSVVDALNALQPGVYEVALEFDYVNTFSSSTQDLVRLELVLFSTVSEDSGGNGRSEGTRPTAPTTADANTFQHLVGDTRTLTIVAASAGVKPEYTFTVGSFSGFQFVITADARRAPAGAVRTFKVDNYSVTSSTIPEPSSIALLMLGGLLMRKRR